MRRSFASGLASDPRVIEWSLLLEDRSGVVTDIIDAVIDRKSHLYQQCAPCKQTAIHDVLVRFENQGVPGEEKDQGGCQLSTIKSQILAICNLGVHG